MTKDLVRDLWKKLRHAGRRAATPGRSRPVRFERLETRLPLAASVVLSGDTLLIRGDGGTQELIIEDAHTASDKDAVVWFDADGDGDFSGPDDLDEVSFGEVDKFDIRLRGGEDVVEFALRDNYEGASKKIYADLGSGDDFFSVEATGISILSSKLSVVAIGRGGVDETAFNPGPIGALPSGGSSRVHVDFSTGGGEDLVDMVLNEPIDDNSSLRFHASLGGGNDTSTVFITPDTYDILGDSAVAISVDGGRGDDVIDVLPSTTDELMMQSGLTVALWGGGGADTITVDLGTVNFDDARVKVFVDGGRGDDTLSVSINAAASSTSGKLGVLMLGGRGEDSLTIDANDASGNVRSFLLLHGGRGLDECLNNGTLSAYLISCEL